MLGQPLYMLMPQVVGFKLHGKLARGRHRDRPGADRHADAAQEGRGREVRRVLRPRARQPERWPTAPRSPTWRPSTAPPSASSRSTTRRSTTCAAPAASDDAGRAGRGATPRSRACSAPTATPDPMFTRHAGARPRRRVEPSLAGPKRPQDRVPLAHMKSAFREALAGSRQGPRLRRRRRRAVPVEMRRRSAASSKHGAVVIAAITSCTNTSNPSVMLGAGLLARRRSARGLQREAVGEDQPRAGLEGGDRLPARSRPARRPRAARLPPGRLRLHDLHRQLRAAARAGRARPSNEGDLVAAAVLVGQPQLRGPRQPADVKANYLASPPLVVAYALAGTMDIDLDDASRIGTGTRRQAGLPARHLADPGGGAARRCEAVDQREHVPRRSTRNVFDGDPHVERDAGAERRPLRRGTTTSTYIKSRRSSTA